MSSTTERLQARANATRDLIAENRITLSRLDIGWSERSSVVVSLALASMDTADTLAYLLATEPEQRWVQALALQRMQLEYMLRAAFFAGAASADETEKFRRKGQMPRRGKSTIYLLALVREASDSLGWDAPHLVETVRHHHQDLSGLVHGGRELLAIYNRHDDIGDLTIPWESLMQPLENTAGFAQLALSVPMRFSRLSPAELHDVIDPAYKRGIAYFASARDS